MLIREPHGGARAVLRQLGVSANAVEEALAPCIGVGAARIKSRGPWRHWGSTSRPYAVKPLGDDLLAQLQAVAADERVTGRGKALLQHSRRSPATATTVTAAVLAAVPVEMTSQATPMQLSQM